MIQRPAGFGTFQFAVMAALRAAQLMRGCLPKVEGLHTVAVTAQLEVAQGKILLMPFILPVVASEDTPPTAAGDR
jgi:hypothetical protein